MQSIQATASPPNARWELLQSDVNRAQPRNKIMQNGTRRLPTSSSFILEAGQGKAAPPSSAPRLGDHPDYLFSGITETV